MARYQLLAIDDKEGKTKYDVRIIPICRGGELKDQEARHDLFEIDAVTLQFSSLYQLEIALKERNCIPHELFHFKIGYVQNKEDRTLDIVINDPFLFQCAIYCCRQKRVKKQTKAPTLPSNFPGMQEFISEVLNYLKDDTIFVLLMTRNRDAEGRSLVPYQLLELARSYHILIQKNFKTPNEVFEYQQIKKKVYQIFENYKNVRGMRIWQTLYLQNKLIPPYKKRFQNNTYEPRIMGYYRSVEHHDTDTERDPDELAYLTPDEEAMLVSGDEGSGYKYIKR